MPISFQPAPYSLRADETWIRRVVGVVNSILQGKTNNTGQVTLRQNNTTTTVTDARASINSVINLTPVTADSALLDSLGWWISAKNNGSFTITHASQNLSDLTFDYTIIG